MSISKEEFNEVIELSKVLTKKIDKVVNDYFNEIGKEKTEELREKE